MHECILSDTYKQHTAVHKQILLHRLNKLWSTQSAELFKHTNKEKYKMFKNK